MSNYDWFSKPDRDGWEAVITVRFPKKYGHASITPDVIKYLVEKELKNLNHVVEYVAGINVSEFKAVRIPTK